MGSALLNLIPHTSEDVAVRSSALSCLLGAVFLPFSSEQWDIGGKLVPFCGSDQYPLKTPAGDPTNGFACNKNTDSKVTTLNSLPL